MKREGLLYLVYTMCRNRAIHNDKVAIRLIPSSQSQESESGGPINMS